MATSTVCQISPQEAYRGESPFRQEYLPENDKRHLLLDNEQVAFYVLKLTMLLALKKKEPGGCLERTLS